MHKTIFKGSGTAMITPMKEDGSINFDAYEKALEFQIENNTAAIIVCGTTGEAPVLTDSEKYELIKFTVKKVNKRIPVIAGAGCNNTKTAVNLSNIAYNAGADALLHVTPYYNKCTVKGLAKHFKECAAAADIPIILYNVPSRTGVDIDISIYHMLKDIDNIVGIKEASGSITKSEKILAEFGERYDIYSGCDDIIFPLMCIGAKGVISVLSNILPKQTADICECAFKSDIKTGSALQLEYLDLINALFIETNPAPVKAALNLLGFEAGTPRLPLTEPEDKNIEKIKQVLKKHSLI